MHYGCIGEHLKHSFSKEIHGLLGDYRYEIREIAPADLDAFLRAGDFMGINVTIPYKEKVIPYLSYIDKDAERIGAVNTVVNRDGKLYGYNTDFYGMRSLIEHLRINMKDQKVAVLGTGGTSKTARAVAESMGASCVLRVSRSAKEDAIDYDTLYRDHCDVGVIINTTPCGMYPNPNGVAVDISRFPRLIGVVDAVYNPLRPTLVLNAKQCGIPTEGGLYMLVAQAVRASEIFLDQVYPAETLERIYQKILRQKENIVLVGMPGSGKTTVGKLLAEQLGREFCDMDVCIQNTIQQPVSEYLAANGEPAFRDLEARVLAEQIAQRTSLVIATGGGAILRDENVAALRRNGRLYFLDRPIEDIQPTADRPLSSSVEALRKRYEERYGRYCAVADVHIDVNGSAENVADNIRKEYNI